MDSLTQILREEVEKYTGGGRGAGLILFPLLDDEHQTYAVTAVDYPERSPYAGVVVLARVTGDKVIVEADGTDKPLVDALVQRGIPREQIVLAYAGEPIPDPERFEL
jgi:hypothetical protein